MASTAGAPVYSGTARSPAGSCAALFGLSRAIVAGPLAAASTTPAGAHRHDQTESLPRFFVRLQNVFHQLLIEAIIACRHSLPARHIETVRMRLTALLDVLEICKVLITLN